MGALSALKLDLGSPAPAVWKSTVQAARRVERRQEISVEFLCGAGAVSSMSHEPIPDSLRDTGHRVTKERLGVLATHAE